MNSLIKNELSKIFHKKALYIVLIITIAFIFLNCILDKVFSNIDTILGPNETSLQQAIDSLDKNKASDKDAYYSLSADLESLKLSKKYKKNSWQRYIINERAYEIIEPMLRSEGTDEYELNKQQYDNFIKKLDSGDWKVFANEDLNSINSEIKIYESMSEEEKQEHLDYIEGLMDQKKALEARLEKNIPYGDTSLNRIIDSYAGSSSSLRDLEKKDKLNQLSYQEKVDLQNAKGAHAIYDYSLNHKIDDRYDLAEFELNKQVALASKADQYTVLSHEQYDLFIIIAIVIIAGTIVSEESNKGTIKLLLVRPYKRTKILLAKFISCLIVLGIVSLVIPILQFMIGGIFFGFNNYVGNIIIYNFNTGTVQGINSFVFLIISWLSVLPEYLLLLTLAFALSTIFNSSALAIAISLLGSMVAGIINGLAVSFKQAEFLKFFVTPNWNLSGRLFGKLPQLEGMTIPFSICICAIYFIVLIILSFQVFKKRDIKNV